MLLIFACIKYTRDNFQLSTELTIIFAVILFVISMSGVGIGIAVSDLGVFPGCSITFLFYCLLLMGYSLIKIVAGLKKANTIPVFFSPWVFPIYQYVPSKQKIERNDHMGLQLFIGIGLVSTWSISCVI